MRDREADKENLLKLCHHQTCYVAWSEEGGGEVVKVFDVYVLFCVPQYGGISQYEATYTARQIDELLDVVYSWT